MSHITFDQLRTELKATNVQIATLKEDLQVAEEDDKTNLQEQLNTAERRKEEIKNEVFNYLVSEDQLYAPSATNHAPSCELQEPYSQPVIVGDDRDTVIQSTETRDPGFAVTLPKRREGTPTMRIQQPKEYKKGEDFSTFSYRYKIFVASAGVPKHMQANMLLNNVDDETLQKLAPLIENLTVSEKGDLNILLAKCHEELFPLSEVRALRQQLTAGCTKQKDDEDVDSFACRLRSIANRAAYNSVSERSEVCLNAFLHGVNDELYDKILATPGAENDFEIAVSAGRKFEKMKRTRDSTSPLESQLTQVLRINDNTHRESGENRYRQHSSRGSRDTNRRSYQTDSRPRHNYSADSGADSSNHRTDRPATRGNSRRGRTENRTCFRCRQVGHIARNCTANLEHLN